MRIAIINQYRRLAGGIETYLDDIIPGLIARGHDVLLISEKDEPEGRPRVASGSVFEEVQTGMGRGEDSWRKASEWDPDVVFLQGMSDPVLESRFCCLAPVVAFSHVYSGACISGTRFHQFPKACQCDKVFGPACLLHYLPRRCGGLSPLTMIKEYRKQHLRLRTLKNAAAMAVSTGYVAEVFRRTGVGCPISIIGLPVRGVDGTVSTRSTESGPVRLLYMGRLEPLKGVDLLIRALPAIAKGLSRPVRLRIAGDGPQRSELEKLWAQISETTAVEVSFEGWVDSGMRMQLWLEAHLLVMPSLWPEPFGLAGLEAGSTGLPVAAFDVGGVSEWLKEGINGHLAASQPCNVDGLAAAVHRCLADEAHYRELSHHAREQWADHSLLAHLDRLIPLLAAHCRR